MRHPARTMWVLALAVFMTSTTAQADQRVDSKPYDGNAVNDCGATFSNNRNRTEVCFDVRSGDETLDLIIHDVSGLAVAAAVYFEDDDDNLLESRGTADGHFLCNRGDTWGRFGSNHDPVFLVPPLATKVLINLGNDTLTWDSAALFQCSFSGRPGHWGTTGTIEAIFNGGS